MNPTRCKAMTGYRCGSLSELVPYFEQAHNEYLSRYHLNGSVGSGLRQFVLYANIPLPSVAERLAFILSYCKLNPLLQEEQHADLFGIEQQQCNVFVHGLQVILDKSLALAQAVPAQTDAQLQTVLAASKAHSTDDPVSKHLLHEGVGRQIPRPQDPDAQQTHYSGKRRIIPLSMR